MSPQMYKRIERVDILFVIIAISVLVIALWTWLLSLQIAREMVLLATTIALVIALVLVLNVSILIIFRLQRRISYLEESMSHTTSSKSDSSLQKEEPQLLVVTLSNTERRVINCLEDNGGRITQDELRRITGLSKSTLSMTIGALERKSIVERAVAGRTRIVVLKSHIKK